ncbi:hypothetical protein TSUD_358280 [Trifolium subterraneum]|uniref:DUF4220 domain-containing protein n=1 Tax=Trifolium subterraneum TaxID=3900 RepID=A0A2Z6MNC3_TRISU|nr:hypothetical protein TSUD_358280 [Trifolium subterraneum]
MEIELGFMYDVFYTKAAVVYSVMGFILRCVTLSCTISVLVAFLFMEKNQYPRVDVLITDTMLWLSMHKNKVLGCPVRNTTTQIQIPRSSKKTDDMKEIIFEHFVNKINEVTNKGEKEFAKNMTSFCYHGGNKVLEGLESELMLQNDKGMVEEKIKKIRWSMVVEFDQSIPLWHIATNLCYNSVSEEEVLENGRSLSYREASKWLSEYMLYLLVMRPSMLPNGIGEIRFQDTCAEATEFVKDRHSIQDENQVCQMIHKVSRDIEKVSPSEVKGDRSKSVLFDAFRLAKDVREIRYDDEEWETKNCGSL